MFQRDDLLRLAGYGPGEATADATASETGSETGSEMGSEMGSDTGTRLGEGETGTPASTASLAPSLAGARAGARARLAEAEANLPTSGARVAEAEAARARAQLDLDTAEKLAADGYAAQTRVLSARAALATARAAVISAEAGAAGAEAAIESARAAVAATERDIATTRVTARFDGMLETDTAEIGSLMMAGSLCATIIDLDPIKLVGYVAEVDVDRVTPGAPVGARLASGREVVGKVTFLSRCADPQTRTRTRTRTRTFRVEAELANPDLSIRDGQTAEIGIQSAGHMAHLLPQSSLTLDDASNLGVRVADGTGSGDVARFVPVDMLRDSPQGVWVAGLPDVARVITTGQDHVTDGTAISVTLEEPGA